MIYFSFGSCVRSVDIPTKQLNVFIETFRRLKQKVLWKFENETMPNMPSNVMIRQWIPQNDVLAHENVVLFLAHGGNIWLLSLYLWRFLFINENFLFIYGNFSNSSNFYSFSMLQANNPNPFKNAFLL